MCFRLSVTILLWSCCAFAMSADLRPWEVYELELTAKSETQIGYVESLPDGGPSYVTVDFRGESGETRDEQYTLTGFWDGGQSWRVRFAPPASGEWSQDSHSVDAGLNGQTGRLKCVPWTAEETQANLIRRGFVRVCNSGPRAGHYFTECSFEQHRPRSQSIDVR